MLPTWHSGWYQNRQQIRETSTQTNFHLFNNQVSQNLQMYQFEGNKKKGGETLLRIQRCNCNTEGMKCYLVPWHHYKPLIQTKIKRR